MCRRVIRKGNLDRLYHEIYLSDARKVVPEKWKTVIRHPMKKDLDKLHIVIKLEEKEYAEYARLWIYKRK
mgnify:CR=1 FL=1